MCEQVSSIVTYCQHVSTSVRKCPHVFIRVNKCSWASKQVIKTAHQNNTSERKAYQDRPTKWPSLLNLKKVYNNLQESGSKAAKKIRVSLKAQYMFIMATKIDLFYRNIDF